MPMTSGTGNKTRALSLVAWGVTLATFFLVVVAGVSIGSGHGSPPFPAHIVIPAGFVLTVALLIVATAGGARELLQTGRPRWWLVLTLVFDVGVAALLFLWWRAGMNCG